MATKNNVVEITRMDVLITEKNKALKQLTEFEIDIKICDRSDAKSIVAREPLKMEGEQVLSWKEITAQEYASQLRQKAALTRQKLEAIGILMKEEKEASKKTKK